MMGLISSMSANRIDSRDQLIYALTEVAELEHLLLCQYLYTAATMKEGIAELGDSPRKYVQSERLREWKAAILRIAREEMQHLTYANNLLVSAGGAPYFSRPNFPNENRFYKKGPDDHGLPMSLERFCLDTIDRYIRFETSEVEVPETRLKELAAIPDPNYYETLHELYVAIRDAFTDEMLIDVDHQYDPVQEYEAFVRVQSRKDGLDVPNIVRSADEAKKLIDEIMQQGEGASPGETDPRAHVNIFRQIRKQLADECDQDPNFEPSRKVVSNPLTRRYPETDIVTTVEMTIVPKDTDDGLQHRMLQLFAGTYQIQLAWLKQIFARQGTAAERRAIETLTFLPYMSEVIRPLSEIVTMVPLKLGSDTYLGPSFEVTTNNFLIAAEDKSPQLTEDRLHSLERESRELVDLLNSNGLHDVAVRLKEVQETLRLFREEFKSRRTNGWVLDFGWPSRTGNYPLDSTYSEGPGILWQRPRPTDPPDWTPPSVLELEFKGWAQCRLATDPDGAFSRRGVTGNAFANGSEPDLDRIIRFQPANCVRRSHCPQVGVRVVAARLLQTALHAPQTGTSVEAFVGAQVDLLDEPRFEGRNHLVAEDGEPIDPFELEIKTHSGVCLRRSVIGPPINGMVPEQRRGSGRYPVFGAQVLMSAMRANLAGMDEFASPQDFVAQRELALRKDLEAIPEADRWREEAVALQARLDVLKAARWNVRSVRWTRFFFNCEYMHTISGRMHVDLNGLSRQFEVRKPVGEQPEKDPNAKWLINYFCGFYDTDALAFYVRGLLRIPVTIW